MKKYIKRVNCGDKCKMVGTISDDSSDRTYLQAISRGGLMIPSLNISVVYVMCLCGVCYFHRVCIFSLIYLGVIKYKNMGKMYQIFYQYSRTH